jgi:hypothetical protein
LPKKFTLIYRVSVEIQIFRVLRSLAYWKRRGALKAILVIQFETNHVKYVYDFHVPYPYLTSDRFKPQITCGYFHTSSTSLTSDKLKT